MLCSDFGELIDMMKNITEEEKKTVFTLMEGDTVKVVMLVDGQETIIFSAQAKYFVYPFFLLLGIDVDDNLGI